MSLSWHIICAENTVSQIEAIFQGKNVTASRYWKDAECLELRCTYESDMEESHLIDLCRQISGIDRVSIDRQPTGTEYACYVSLEEIKNGEKAFVVCFVNKGE